MAHAGMNYIAVLVAAGAGFAFGAVYYTLFGRAWLGALGKSRDEVPGAGGSVRPFVVAAVAMIVIAFVLAGSIGHLGPGQVTPLNGVISAAISWAGFVVAPMAVNYAFQGARPFLTVIDAGHWLGVLVLQGLIIGLMGI